MQAKAGAAVRGQISGEVKKAKQKVAEVQMDSKHKIAKWEKQSKERVKRWEKEAKKHVAQSQKKHVVSYSQKLVRGAGPGGKAPIKSMGRKPHPR
mmetsp:Transcript_28626/g.91308  ORF Transcript_28626/g.91308 Transcript_28626/m.91308 type:complete len:95 (+) Transcript_28626:124-408(+)